MLNRLFMCNGPMQILNVLTLIEEQGNKSSYSDYLCIYGTLVEKNSSHPIYLSVEQLASHHIWSKVIYIYDSSTFKFEERALFEMLGREYFDEIFVVRNRGAINKFIIEVFKDAKIIVYGDNLGTFDSLVCEYSEYYPRIDEIRTIVPVFSTNKFEYIKEKIKKIHISYFEMIINKIAQNMSLEQKKFDKEYTVYLTAYFSKLEWCSLEEEVDIYVNHIEHSIEITENILIKPHPRDGNDISKRLKKRLEEKGFNVKVLDLPILQALPIEILVSIIKIKEVVTPGSAALIGLNILYPYIKTSLMTKEYVTQYISQHRIKEFFESVSEIISKYNKINVENDEFIIHNTNTYQEKSDIRRDKIQDQVQMLVENLNYQDGKVFYYGAGSYLYEINIIKILKEKEISVQGILDKSLEKQGTKFLDLEIYHTSVLENMVKAGEKVYILITSSFQNEISLYLNSLGLIENTDYYKVFYDIHA